MCGRLFNGDDQNKVISVTIKLFVMFLLFSLSTGKGRGRQVIAVARTSDVILMMLDAGKPHVYMYTCRLTLMWLMCQANISCTNLIQICTGATSVTKFNLYTVWEFYSIAIYM